MQRFELPVNPKISIIITTYNGSTFIEETIESIRQQTYPYWELIIIDDGSTDDTHLIVASINDKKIHFCQAGRIGVNGIIKNIGLSKATGELIAFIDHDDLWAQDKLEKQVKALQQYPSAGFCLCNGYNFKNTIKNPVSYLYGQKEGIKVGDIFLSFFCSEMSPWTQTLLVRKQCIKKAGDFSETSLFADPEFIVNLSFHFDAVILYEPLFYHRMHVNGYSVTNWIQCHEQGLAIIRKYKKSKQLPVTIANEALFRSHINFGEKYLLQKKKAKAMRHFLKAWRNKIASLIPLKKIGKAVLYSSKCIMFFAVS